MARDARPIRRGRVAAVVTAVLLVAVAFEGRARARAAETAPLFERVRAAAKQIPYSVGDWLGRDVEAQPAAIALLRPNVLVNRVYENLRTGETANLFFVHCADARDLLGHYPPVCYPARGLGLVGAKALEPVVGSTAIEAMRYRFSATRLSASSEIVVDNFMVLPTGRFGRDMEAVNRVAEDLRLRRFGATEVQLVTDGASSDEHRDAVFRELIRPLLPFFESLRAETDHE